MHIWHLTCVAPGRQTLYPRERDLLGAVRALVRGAAGSLVVFCIVDDHVHAVIETERPGRVATGVLRALRAVTPLPLEPAHRREVRSRTHLERLTHEYLLIQPRKHALRGPAPLWPGSCFLDLAGARSLPGPPLRLWQVLPRYRLRDAFRSVGLAPLPPQPASCEDLRHTGATRIVVAAAAAAGIDTAQGRDALAISARRAAAGLCRLARIPPRDVARALGIQASSVCRLLREELDESLGLATRLRLALEDRVTQDALTDRLGCEDRDHPAHRPV